MKTLQHKRGTAAILAANNPVIPAGEICIETDTNKIKIGDGTTAWNSLSYALKTTVRSDFVSGFMYIGTAPSGSSESSAVWTIKKTLVTSAGTISTRTTATGVQWANRLSATYA